MKSLHTLRKEWVSSENIASEDFLVLSLHVLEKNRADFFKESDYILTDKQYEVLIDLLKRRKEHEPVAYLVGEKEFFGRSFLVNPDTLVPRPETETLIEDVLNTFKEQSQKPQALLDVGTGSGIIAITLEQELKNASVQMLASDISKSALTVAQKNRERYQANVTFLHGSLLAPYIPLISSLKNIYIVANLPYVSPSLYEKTPPDVQKHEPITALLSEKEGLAHYLELLSQIKKNRLHGTAWLEISPEQSHTLQTNIRELFPKASIFVGIDLSQRERFIRFTF